MIRTFIILFLLIISNDLSGINNTKKLKVGGEIDSAPFSYINEDGELEGFSVELLQNILSDLNYDFEFSHYNKLNFKRDNIEFNNRILYECDLSLIAIPSLAHKRLHYYSIPYSQINYLIIGRADKPFSGLKDLSQSVVLVHKGTISETKLKSLPQDLFSSIIKVQSTPIGIKMLAEGNADYMVIDDHSIKSFENDIFRNNLNIYPSNFEPISISFASNNGDIIREINTSINTLKENGTFDKIYDRWLGAYKTHTISYYIYIMLSVLVILIILFIILTYTHRIAAKNATYKFQLQNKEINELKHSLEMALDAGQMIVWSFTIKNQLFKVIHGTPIIEDELTFNKYLTYIHPDDINILTNTLHNILANYNEEDKITIKFRQLNESLDYIWYECSVMPVYKNNDIDYIIGISRDITNEMKATLELKKSQGMLQSIIDKLPIPIYIFDPKSNIFLFSNDDAKKTYGIYENKSTSSIISTDTSNAIKDINANIIGTDKEYINNESLVLSNGETKNTFVKKIPILFNNNKQILAVRIDLTEREKLLRAQRLVSTSLPSLNAFTWSIDGRDETIEFGSTVELVGVSIEDINSINKCSRYIHPEDKHIFINALRTRIEERKSESFSIIYRIRFSESVEYEWWETKGVSEYINYESGGYVILYGVTSNINTQKNNEIWLRKSQEELLKLNKKAELILNNTSSGIVYLNKDYIVEWSNFSAIPLFQKHQNIYKVGQKCHSSFEFTDRPCDNCPMARAIESRGPVMQEFEVKDTGVFEVLATPIIENNNISGVVLRIDDITERRELINDLQVAKIKAEESDKLKMAFLANMSHEIRTPLNAIIGFSQLLQYAEDEQERKSYMDIITTNNDLLLRLINDILDLSKIESGSMEIKKEKFDIVETLNTIYLNFKDRCSEKNILMQKDCELDKLVIYQDHNRLSQIFVNFTTNAIKYSINGEITIGLEYINNGVKIYVKDSGIGIPDSKKHLIFRRFEKLDDFAQGTGLGLSICKAIVETIGGEIGFESQENKGSYFWAWIPCEVINE